MMPPPGAHGGPGGTAIVHAPQPPYLASQTAARMGRPVEPFNGGLQTALILFGVLLTAAFVVPLAMKDDTYFWWDLLDKLEGKQKVVPILLAAAGVLGLTFGAVPLAATARGAGAAALGIAPLLYAALALPPEIQWQGPVGAVGGILLPAGLLLRSAYRDQVLGRALATAGAVMVLAVWLVPQDGKMPLQAVLDVLGADKVDTELKIGLALRLLYPVLAALALLVWLPATSTGGGTALAWLWICAPIVVHYGVLLATGEIGKAAGEAPYLAFFSGLEAVIATGGARGGEAMMFLSPGGVVLAGYLAFAGFGLAALLGKNLER